jgi:hypothetical protein
MEIHRRDIKNAPYNARSIDKHAKRSLERKLKARGLLKALVWNKRTGNLVEGHQRLDIMDALEVDDNWRMTINVVDLSPEQEVEENIAFNNEQLMGYYDTTKLELALQTDGLDLAMTGFDKMDLEQLFPNSEFVAGLFADDAQPGPTDEAVKKLDEMAEQRRQAGITARELAAAANDNDKERDSTKTKRLKMKAEKKSADAVNDIEFYAVVVFENREQVAAFMKRIGEDESSRYTDGQRVASHLDLELPT